MDKVFDYFGTEVHVGDKILITNRVWSRNCRSSLYETEIKDLKITPKKCKVMLQISSRQFGGDDVEMLDRVEREDSEFYGNFHSYTFIKL